MYLVANACAVVVDAAVLVHPISIAAVFGVSVKSQDLPATSVSNGGVHLDSSGPQQSASHLG